MTTVSAPDLVRYRTTRHACKLGLDCYVAPIIWTTQVNGAHTRGDTTITVDVPTVVRAPGKNYQLLFGTAAGGSDLGETRFLSYSAPTLTIPVNNFTLPNDAYVTVREEVKPQSIHIGMNASDVVFEDGSNTYADENLNYMPLARCGTHAVAFRDALTGLATLKFYSRSTAIAAGATLASCAWTLRGGTYTAGNSTTFGTSGVPNVATWNTSGDYYCSFAVTDSNGKTHTRYFVVMIRDRVTGTLSHTSLELGSIEGDAESGVWSTTATVYTTADQTTFPDRALVVISADDYFGSENISIGNETYRENIVFVGYVREGTTKKDPVNGTVQFTIESVSGVMGNMAALAGGLERTAGTPADWHTLKNLTYNLAVHHVLTQHTTVSQVCDVYPNLPTYGSDFLDLPEGKVANQLKSVIGAVRGQMGCNAQGHLYFEVNPQLQVPASRSTTYVLDTTFADLRAEIDFGSEKQERQVSQISFTGETDIGDPLFSVAPAEPWDTGDPEPIDHIRVADQAEANDFAGVYEGNRNNPFTNVVIQWRGNYRCWDVYPREPLRVTSGTNKRGIAWVNQRCWTKRVTFEYTPGVLLASTVIERDATFTTGSGEAEGQTPPSGGYPTVLPTLPTPPILPPYPPPIGASGARQMYDFMDGWISATANTTHTGFYGLSGRRFRITNFGVTSVQTGFTLKIYAGYATAALTCKHEAGNDWTCKIYDSAGVLISTLTGAAGTNYSVTLTGANIISIPSANMAFKTELVNGASVATVPYFIGAETY